MQAVLKETKQFSHLLEWCLIASLLIHALIMFTLPKPDYDLPPPNKQEIRIELVKPEPPAVTPAPPAPAEPEVVKPTPPKPQPQPPKLEPKPVEQKPVTPQKPSPMPEQAVETPRPVVESPAPAVIAAKPSVSETKSEVVVPPPAPPAPPEPVKASGPSEGDIDAARNAFRSAAHRELKKNQRYPRIAQDRGIEGDVKLSINIDDHGNITNIEVVESSGNKAIDDAALAAAQKSQLKPHFHEILRGRINNIIVTVSFKLSS
ncbi:TonB family protein [Methylophilus sp. YYY-1]|uniref:energy transducer TonB n=1 Tax=Methylophilus sp. YYY-1 TaxID=2682087 RepID=UPI0023B2D3FD|nr:TonB family protein [Methylophilus sp. YYY-1]MDF0378054.1 TonB family protein [Methylophilus sp. YYY-1]